MRKTMVSCALIALVSWAALPLVSWAAIPVAAARLEPGARIRWVSTEEPNTIRIGTLAALTSDTLFVSGGPGASGRSLPLSEVSQLEVSQGRPSKVGGYAVIGGVCGGLTGLALAAIADAGTSALASAWGAEPDSHVPYHRFFLVGGGIGAGIGALIGVGSPVPEKWKPVDHATLRLGLGLAGRGLCLTVRY